MDQVKSLLPQIFSDPPHNSWFVITKKDKGIVNKIKTKGKIFEVSSLTGEGIPDLRSEILKQGELSEEDLLLTSSRHYENLMKMKESLERAKDIEEERDLMALELREGLLSLYEILGQKIDDKVLDNIFKEFCIGK